ncbi:hypothetical protein DICPUDRAFT_73962 [Dictyostelium purpureum]|uniref:Zinc transporter n=1 Tax=Dictyostelium purpureum TaxID=5786 RepID=F0Z6D3_DICPU|nr:uncharacterized protein DICPUDRAFT_73962 [Dictyostelium purpureum]EGC40467.1 hypothetical protein DICPUDRAFT_73962 [Dictyostelium purpureum]|eukprot:XP_003283014.1 hypothetical protein DICPUDRAFT_73962 [Dictyostelium purpureum]
MYFLSTDMVINHSSILILGNFIFLLIHYLLIWSRASIMLIFGYLLIPFFGSKFMDIAHHSFLLSTLTTSFILFSFNQLTEDVYFCISAKLADTLGGVGIIVLSLTIQIWGYTLADPICLLYISILIFLSVLPLINGTAKTLYNVPDSITQKILGTPGLLNYHFWGHYYEMNIATLKIQVDSNADNEKIKKSISKFLKHDYSVHKTLIEFVNLLNNSNNNNNNNE